MPDEHSIKCVRWSQVLRGSFGCFFSFFPAGTDCRSAHSGCNRGPLQEALEIRLAGQQEHAILVVSLLTTSRVLISWPDRWCARILPVFVLVPFPPKVYARAVRGGSDKSAGLGSSGGHGRGSTDSFRGGARSPGLPSPNTLLLRSLSSSSAISRVSSHFSHFTSSAAPVELQLPVSFRRRGSGAEGDEAAHAFGGSGASGGREPSGTLDARAARAKYLPDAGEGGGGGAAAAAAATAGENAARAAKSKPQWGWGAGKSIFGKRAPVEVRRSDNPEPEAPPEPPSGTKSTALAAAAVEVAQAASHALKTSETKETKAQQGGGRRLAAAEVDGTYREPGGERGRGTRSAAEQRSRLERESADDRREAGGAVVRSRDKRQRQSRSVDSPGKVAKLVPATADAAVEAAHGFFSVPAASHADARDGAGGKSVQRQRERSASTENEESARYERRENNDRENRFVLSAEKSTALGGYRGRDRGDARRRRSPAPAGTRRERESTQRPSRAIGRTRTRSEERVSRTGEGKQWSDLANPRPPLPYPSPAPLTDVLGASSGGALLKRSGGGSGGISTASPVNSTATSDDKSRASRGMDDNSSSAGWGTSSLAGWGETMAAEAEAEVLGRSHRNAERQSGASKGDSHEDGVVDPTLREQPERTRLHQMVAALTDLCMYLVGVSPLSMEECPTMLEHLPNDDDDWDEVSTS